MKRKLLIVACCTFLFVMNFNKWYWWNLNLAIKIGTIMEQCEPNAIERD